MINFLVSLIVAIVVLGLIFYLLNMLPLPEPFRLAARVLFIIVCVLVVLYLASPLLHVGR